MRHHVDEVHPYLELSDENVEDFVAAGLRARPWDGQPLPLPDDLQLRRLDPSLAEALLDYFDRDAFADSPAMAGCYCNAQHFRGSAAEWKARRAAENRQDMKLRILQERATGIVALSGERVIGWCNAGPRSNYPGLNRYPELELAPGEDVGSIVCFVVAPAYRHQGLSARLLGVACELLLYQGLRVAEGYPFQEHQPMGMGDFLGSPRLFREEGFDQERAVGKRVVMRKILRP